MESIKSSLNYIFDRLTQKWMLLGVFGVVAALSWIAVYASAQSNQVEVYFFDVGQGDAIFIEMPDGRQILIDGGPNDKVLEKLNSVMPFWDRSIDIMIATHGEADHITGLVSVLEHYDVDVIIWNGVPSSSKIFNKWHDAILIEGGEILVAEYGARFILSDFAFFEILHPFNPSGSDPDGLKQKQNELSIVIRFVYGDDSFLFTGDIERQGEYKIMRDVIYLQADVLKVAHHGSKTSSSELFLEKIKPKIAVISSGSRNPYGHPHQAILQRLEDYDIEIRRTDEEGDIVLLSSGNSF